MNKFSVPEDKSTTDFVNFKIKFSISLHIKHFPTFSRQPNNELSNWNFKKYMECLRLRPERRQESMGKRSEAIEWRAQMTSSTWLAFLTAVITSPTFSMILVSSSLLLFFESFSMFFVFSIILFLRLPGFSETNIFVFWKSKFSFRKSMYVYAVCRKARL